ncbi:hypothetical protein LTR84_005856 [Exophiala bonariae]|uniref:Major facilitator superfamily (MFS) profile domain-containing protein n=1 Tax=Exophiala bonariae TaxID=1690606 RepID=A0AAV9N2D5_9EURO|nr:hypothetical protein LTR84_005856 [Exophiala bonariae]
MAKESIHTRTNEKATDAENKEKSSPDKDHIGNDRAFKGDDSDGRVNWTIRNKMAALTLGMLYIGSQIVLYMVGAELAYIEVALAVKGRVGWLTVSNTLAITAIAPFTGYLQDVVGRREITLIGSGFVCIGITLVASAHGFGQAVVGMAISGAGAGICELTALAGVSDIVSVKHRGYGVALMMACILPFTPYVIYGQLISSRSNWRWGIWLCLFYNLVVLVGLITTYHPKGHPRMEGVTKRKIASRIDYIGALLSIIGLTILLIALQAGGYSHPWNSTFVLTQLIIGIISLGGWIVWEWKYAQYPMVPKQIFQGQRVVALAFFIAFVGGINFYSLINFYPLSFATMYNPDPIQIGLKGLGYGISVTVGAMFFNALISTSIEVKWILLASATLMTIFGAALINANPTNGSFVIAMGTLAGFGVGGILVPAATVALVVVPDSLLATTAALSLSIRTLGGTIGYTIYLAVFMNKLSTNLPNSVARYVTEAGLSGKDVENFVTIFLTDPANIDNVPGYTVEIAAAANLGSRWGYSESLKWVWVTSVPFGVLAMVACCLLPSIKKWQTRRIAVEL